MSFQGFTKETSDFLWELSFNNERPWFQEHREEYQRVMHEPFHALAEEIHQTMAREFPEENFTLHVSRIYRDARRLFGRGPYNDHLWFTVFNAENRFTEGPMFWFELSPAVFSYGLGFFDVSAAETEAFRKRVDADPARFERLAGDAMKMRGFRVTGPEYKKPKKDLGPIINPWYNRKRFGLQYEKDFDPALLDVSLVDRLLRTYRRLMPLYRYLHECYSSVQEQRQAGQWTLLPAFSQPETLRPLFEEYEALLLEAEPSFFLSLDQQNYSEELSHLEEKYGPPDGRFYLLYVDGALAGCVGMKRLDKEHAELKRLYVRPSFRGRKLGEYLTQRIITDARSEGYRYLRLDTLPSLRSALALYRRMGFYEIPPYYDCLIPGTVFLEIGLN